MTSTPKFSNVQRFSLGNAELCVIEIPDKDYLTLRFLVDTDADCRLHWGLERSLGSWRRPAPWMWPPQTQTFNECAVQSPFLVDSQGKKRIDLRLNLTEGWRNLAFVLFFPGTGRWGKHAGQDFGLALPRLPIECSASTVLDGQTKSDAGVKYDFELEDQAVLKAVVEEMDGAFRVLLASDFPPPLVLHWGLSQRSQNTWRIPPAESRPPGSRVFDGEAVRTPFLEREGVRWLELALPKTGEPSILQGIRFVLFQPDGNRWLKAHGQDMFLPLQPAVMEHSGDRISHHELAETIINAELERILGP